jgi:hypothetical protein
LLCLHVWTSHPQVVQLYPKPVKFEFVHAMAYIIFIASYKTLVWTEHSMCTTQGLKSISSGFRPCIYNIFITIFPACVSD